MNSRTAHLFIFSLTIFAPGGPFAGADLEQPPNTWVKRSPLGETPPCPRLGYEGACAWDNQHKLFIRYGGHNQGGGGAQYSEIWTFDPLTAKWTLKEPDISPPGVCCAQQNVYDPIHSRYVRFPAFSGNHGWQWFREIYLNNSTIWVYDLDDNRWRELRPVPAPHVSGLRCASWDSDAQVIVVFGGEGSQEGTVVYDPHTNTWTRMNPADEPPFRSSGNMVYDSAHKLHIMFGAQFIDDPRTWGYDLSRNEWRDLKPAASPPTDKNDAVLAFDSLNNVVVAIVKISTGEDENAKHRLETWTYDTGKNTWTRMNPLLEPDPTGNRARVLAFAPELGLTILENRTRSDPGPPEQQIWTYCFDHPKTQSETLTPPEGLCVMTMENSAVLTWKPSKSSGITGYEVYRGSGEQPWTVNYQKIGSVDVERSRYEDAGLATGKVYYYCVRATNEGRLSEPSIKVRTQPRIVEDAVVSVLSESEVLLSWIAPEESDIAGYYIERADVEVWTEDQLKRLKSKVAPLGDPAIGAIRRIGPFKRITPNLLKEPSFKDSVDLSKPAPVQGPALQEHRLYDEHLDHSGRAYRLAVIAYRIRAVNALGVANGPSPYFLTIPSSPRRVFAQEDGTTCRLKWAENPEKNLKGYRVYRLDGQWDKDTISRLTDDPIDGATFSDSTAGDHTRRYHIVAVNALGQEGLPSAPVWYSREWRRFYEPFTGQWHQ
ncbi:MAG: fibronectin type III domain-containing protein [Sedimentisphaerales bacterium]|nr:fibronectin type III domain-containing protein [Sedimentisphaerales bacterium]